MEVANIIKVILYILILCRDVKQKHFVALSNAKVHLCRPFWFFSATHVNIFNNIGVPQYMQHYRFVEVYILLQVLYSNTIFTEILKCAIYKATIEMYLKEWPNGRYPQ